MSVLKMNTARARRANKQAKRKILRVSSPSRVHYADVRSIQGCLARVPSFRDSEILAGGKREGERVGGRDREGERGERGIQSGRACSADWYQWRQIELAGDR